MVMVSHSVNAAFVFVYSSFHLSTELLIIVIAIYYVHIVFVFNDKKTLIPFGAFR